MNLESKIEIEKDEALKRSFNGKENISIKTKLFMVKTKAPNL